MFVINVQVHVKPDCIDAFKAATRLNHQNSVLEPNCLRFDLCQDREDPTHFVLWEVYRSAADLDSHKQTAHYALWRDTVEPMMASPRVGVKLDSVFPADAGWS